MATELKQQQLQAAKEHFEAWDKTVKAHEANPAVYGETTKADAKAKRAYFESEVKRLTPSK